MHFAAFYGNYQMIEYIISMGGDPFAQNKCNINMLHVAAQGD
jgi:ankyrin repeat protein